jgi:NAD(P) transhydrogenase subunit beta
MNTLNLSCYLVAAILIILALRGLSSPVTSRRGNYFGMLGMAIAIITTFVMNQAFVFWLIGVAIILGGLIGLIVAKKSSYDKNA